MTQEKGTTFNVVSEVRNYFFNEVSGIWTHAVAVTNDGKVFSHGATQNGRRGISQNDVKDFTLIDSLKCKIVSASAGKDHTLFQGDDGKIYACGKNEHGEIPIKDGASQAEYQIPTETMMTTKDVAAFAALGNKSVFYMGKAPFNIVKNRSNWRHDNMEWLKYKLAHMDEEHQERLRLMEEQHKKDMVRKEEEFKLKLAQKEEEFKKKANEKNAQIESLKEKIAELKQKMQSQKKNI